jgi:hypothetical protein
MIKRLISAVLALGSLIWLGTDFVVAQAEQERVPMIMSKLPSQGSTAYKAIRKRAGAATIQALTLTKAEVWSVPQDSIEALRKTAAKYGVGMTQLAADWNHLFRSAPAVDDKQKGMLAQVTSSKATMGVATMLPHRAAVVEYALTKDAHAPNETVKIIVKLDEGTALTITRTSVDIKSDMCIWRGTVDGTGAPATIMWWPGITMAGRIQHEGRIYSIRRMRGGMRAVAVVAVSDDRMPQDHAPMPSDMRAQESNLRNDPLVQQGDASTLRPKTLFAKKIAPKHRIIRPPAEAPSKDIVIDIIVAYTKKAASHYADVRHELVALSVEEANQSFRISNLGHIKLRLVHAYQTHYVEEGEHVNHLWRFADHGDGYMEEIHALRDKFGADVAVLIVDDAIGCGLATRVFADADEAFAVVHHECAAMTYSVAHEIGHIIGARHEPSVDTTMAPFPYGHGFVNGTKWRDIMSYKQSCGGCPRLPVWSNPKVMIMGEPAGTPELDNARVISEQAARVAAFR